MRCRACTILLSLVLVLNAGTAGQENLPASGDTNKTAAPGAAGTTNLYEFRTASPDGIGKYYMGREISKVMGHEGIHWLERSERAKEEQPETVLRLINLKIGDSAADVGAGSGFFTRRLARAVGETGRLFAVDIEPRMLVELTNRLNQAGITNVTPVLGGERDPRLPGGSIDLALLVDVYHELEYPREMMTAIARSLKPEGRVVLVEYRAEDPAIPIKPLHKLSEAQARRELDASGFEWIRTHRDLPTQHILEFRKKSGL